MPSPAFRWSSLFLDAEKTPCLQPKNWSNAWALETARFHQGPQGRGVRGASLHAELRPAWMRVVDLGGGPGTARQRGAGRDTPGPQSLVQHWTVQAGPGVAWERNLGYFPPSMQVCTPAALGLIPGDQREMLVRAQFRRPQAAGLRHSAISTASGQTSDLSRPGHRKGVCPAAVC